MKKITILFLVLWIVNVCSFSQSKYTVFADKQYSDRMEQARRMNDAGLYYEAYEHLRQLKEDADTAISVAGQTAATLTNAADFNFYSNIISSISECAYASNLYLEIFNTSDLQFNIIDERLKRGLGKAEDFTYAIGTCYKSLADAAFLYSDLNPNAYKNSKIMYEWAMHSWHQGGYTEDSVAVNIDMAQLEYSYANYKAAKKYLQNAITGLSRRNMGTGNKLSDAEKARARELLMIKSSLAMTEAHLNNYGEALTLIDDVIAEAGKKSPDMPELLRRRTKITMLRYLNGGEYDRNTVKNYKQYFSSIKGTVSQQFLKMTNSKREQYWMNQRGFVTDCYQLENLAPDFLYDVTLYNKGILLQTCRSFDNLLTKSERDRLSELRKLDAENISKGKSSEESEKYEKELLSLISKDGRAKQFFKELVYTWKDVQKVLPKEGCAMEIVEYEKNDSNYYGAIIIKSTGLPKFIPLYNRNVIYGFCPNDGERSLEALLRSSNPESSDTIYADKNINDLVWNPIATEVTDCNKIYYAPDGVFHRLAMEYILPESMSGKKVYRLSSTRVLAQGLRPNSDALKNSPLLVMGGVTYKSDNISTTYIPKDNDVNAYQEIHQNAVNSDRDFVSPSFIHDIECDSIIIKRNNSNDLHLAGLNATEAAFYENVPNFSMAHLCTHGGFSEHSPRTTDLLASASADVMSKSFLALSNCVTNLRSKIFDSTNKDGILSAKEIANMDLTNVELFTTSACGTAFGHVTADGVYSVERGFKSAGAKGLIMSLCSVYQHVGRVFFNMFYEDISKGYSIYEAFYDARERMKGVGVTDLIDLGPNSYVRYNLQRMSLSSPASTNSLILIDVWD